jgi:hypothetical protein
MENHPLVDRVRGEFIAMPGLRLTPAQGGTEGDSLVGWGQVIASDWM